MYTSAGAYGAYVDLLPGQLVRLLDVFAAAGAPAGDYDNVNAVFIADGGLAATNRPGLMTFCTVQDNTSFGADFRIGKTSYGTFGIGSNDSTTAREIVAEKDLLGRNFEIDAGVSANTHLVYFRHPDTVKCELLQQGSPWPRLTPTAGLEIRVLNRKGAVIGGGSDAVSTGPMYLGDKSDTPGAYNSDYTIEVESNEQNMGVVRPYALYCASGSGNTAGYELLRYKEPIDRF